MREHEREEGATAAIHMRRHRRDSLEEWITFGNEVDQLRRYLELRFADQRTKMEKRRALELERCEDPADRTYWTHVQIGGDGRHYF